MQSESFESVCSNLDGQIFCNLYGTFLSNLYLLSQCENIARSVDSVVACGFLSVEGSSVCDDCDDDSPAPISSSLLGELFKDEHSRFNYLAGFTKKTIALLFLGVSFVLVLHCFELLSENLELRQALLPDIIDYTLRKNVPAKIMKNSFAVVDYIYEIMSSPVFLKDRVLYKTIDFNTSDHSRKLLASFSLFDDKSLVFEEDSDAPDNRFDYDHDPDSSKFNCNFRGIKLPNGLGVFSDKNDPNKMLFTFSEFSKDFRVVCDGEDDKCVVNYSAVFVQLKRDDNGYVKSANITPVSYGDKLLDYQPFLLHHKSVELFGGKMFVFGDFLQQINEKLEFYFNFIENQDERIEYLDDPNYLHGVSDHYSFTNGLANKSVRLKFDNGGRCSGGFISDHEILTALHCFENKDGSIATLTTIERYEFDDFRDSIFETSVLRNGLKVSDYAFVKYSGSDIVLVSFKKPLLKEGDKIDFFDLTGEPLLSSYSSVYMGRQFGKDQWRVGGAKIDCFKADSHGFDKTVCKMPSNVQKGNSGTCVSNEKGECVGVLSSAVLFGTKSGRTASFFPLNENIINDLRIEINGLRLDGLNFTSNKK